VCAAIAATIAVNRENRKANQKTKKSTVKSVREEIKVKPVCKNYANKKKRKNGDNQIAAWTVFVC